MRTRRRFWPRAGGAPWWRADVSSCCAKIHNRLSSFSMGPVRFFVLWICGAFPAALLASSQAPQAPVPLVLVGGTVVDVTDWGRSAKDLPDAVVIVQNGRITDVGTRAALPVPKGARIIDCTG